MSDIFEEILPEDVLIQDNQDVELVPDLSGTTRYAINFRQVVHLHIIRYFEKMMTLILRPVYIEVSEYNSIEIGYPLSTELHKKIEAYVNKRNHTLYNFSRLLFFLNTISNIEFILYVGDKLFSNLHFNESQKIINPNLEERFASLRKFSSGLYLLKKVFSDNEYNDTDIRYIKALFKKQIYKKKNILPFTYGICRDVDKSTNVRIDFTDDSNKFIGKHIRVKNSYNLAIDLYEFNSKRCKENAIFKDFSSWHNIAELFYYVTDMTTSPLNSLSIYYFRTHIYEYPIVSKHDYFQYDKDSAGHILLKKMSFYFLGFCTYNNDSKGYFVSVIDNDAIEIF